MKKKQIFFSLILILIGIIIFLYPVISNYIAEKNQSEVIREYKENISNIEDNKINQEYEKAKKYNEQINTNVFKENDEAISFNNYENILNLSNNRIMSYIEIPRISVCLPIYHGTSDEVLKKGVGHIENSTLPIGGKNTHCILTGHTGFSRAEIFTKLNELEVDDYFYINTLGKKLIYKIYQIKIVLPTELQDLQIIEGKDLITLVTCTPYGINTHRLLVQGERMEESENIEENIKMEEKTSNQNYYLKYGLIILLLIILMFWVFNHIRKIKNL